MLKYHPGPVENEDNSRYLKIVQTAPTDLLSQILLTESDRDEFLLSSATSILDVLHILHVGFVCGRF